MITILSVAVVILACTSAYLFRTLRKERQKDDLQKNLVDHLIAPAAKKFLARHGASDDLQKSVAARKPWAATVGIKTGSFLVDHDPDLIIAKGLAATMRQIRADEIQRAIDEILRHSNLQQHLVGQKIYGVIDPEQAPRPCLTILLLFAALYLDAGPMLERRLKGLVSVIPIIDPGLASRTSAEKIAALLQKNQWFFFMDYSWVDQHIVQTSAGARYGVSQTSLDAQVSQSMINYLRERSASGNFIWMSADARDRVLMEAPYLANVMEASVLPAELLVSSGHRSTQGEATREKLAFVVKFEQLIPRLQKYFNLDEVRKVLIDFDARPESQKLAQLLRKQASSTQDATELAATIETLLAYPWRGYKEKDLALQVIIEMENRLTHNAHDIPVDKRAALREQLLKAVGDIGYPTQVLHRAQLEKMSLRDIKIMTEIALDSQHPRFFEAWLLIGNGETLQIGGAGSEAVLTFLEGKILADTTKAQMLLQTPFVQAMLLDSLMNLSIHETMKSRVKLLLNKVCVTFCRLGLNQASAIRLLDAAQFFVLREASILEPHSLSVLAQHVAPLNTPAVRDRWAELNRN